MIIFYGPPTSRRGRFLNWIRRRLRLDEHDELYGALPTGPADDRDAVVTAHWTAEGLLYLDTDREEYDGQTRPRRAPGTQERERAESMAPKHRSQFR